MKFENIQVTGFENAIFGARLPMCKDLAEAESKSDSFNCRDGMGMCEYCPYFIDGHLHSDNGCLKETEFDNGNDVFVIGKEDMKLLKDKLVAGDKGGVGQPNSKFLRMIHLQVAITAPLYWWKEMDTYKVGTTANSTSTMHRLANYPITKECFEMDDFVESVMIEDTSEDRNDVNMNCLWDNLIYCLEQLRETYNETKDKRYWKELIRLLPESWLQTRMFDCDYATLANIYHWRKNHKLTEWHKFCEMIKQLPYAEELITGGN